MLLAWALFPTAYFALAGLVFCGIVIVQRRRSRDEGREPRGGGGLALGGCAMMPFALLVFLLFGLPYLHSIRPSSDDFEEGFGRAPTKAIRNLNGLRSGGLDSLQIMLAFHSTPAAAAEVDRLLAAALAHEPTDFVGSLTFSDDTPHWWHGGPPWSQTHGCKDQRASEFEGWDNWQTVAVIDCLSDQRIYVVFYDAD